MNEEYVNRDRKRVQLKFITTFRFYSREQERLSLNIKFISSVMMLLLTGGRMSELLAWRQTGEDVCGINVPISGRCKSLRKSSK